MQIIGHRGARNEAPENTLLGFEYLRSLNIQQVELDVRLSKDQQLVVLHDATLDRTTDHQGKVANYNQEQLAQVNAAARSQQITAFTPVPTLEQTLKEWPELENIQIEVKSTSTTELNIIAAKLTQLISDLNIWHKVWVTSADVYFLNQIKKQGRRGELFRGFVAERWRRQPVATCSQLGCELLVIDWRACSEARIRAAHRAGLEISVWTVNRLDIAQRLQRWGADSLITDLPSLMQRYFC